MPLPALFSGSALRHLSALGLCAALLGLPGCDSGGGSGSGDGGINWGGGGGSGGGGGLPPMGDLGDPGEGLVNSYTGSPEQFGRGSSPPEKFYKEFSKITCDALFGCCPRGLEGAFRTKSECETQLSLFISYFVAPELASGKTAFYPRRAEQCLDMLRLAAKQPALCDTLTSGDDLPGLGDDSSDPNNPCDQVIAGLQGEGESCTEYDEAVEAHMSSDSLCQPGLTCYNFDNTDDNERLCGRPLNLGDPCAPGVFISGCVEGLQCDPESETCQPLKPNGGTCDSSDNCLSGYCSHSEDPPACAPSPWDDDDEGWEDGDGPVCLK